MQATHLLFFKMHLYRTAKQLQGGTSVKVDKQAS